MTRVIKYRHVDATRKIFLPDGTDGQTLRLSPLREKLGHLMQIDPSWGKAEVLDAWEKLLLEKAQVTAGACWRGPSDGLMKQAATAIAEDHA